MDRQVDITMIAQATDLVDHLSTAGPDRKIFTIDLAGRLIGAFGVSAIETTNHTGWCWYWVHVDHRSQGWTSRATAAMAGLGARRTGPATDRAGPPGVLSQIDARTTIDTSEVAFVP